MIFGRSEQPLNTGVKQISQYANRTILHIICRMILIFIYMRTLPTRFITSSFMYGSALKISSLVAKAIFDYIFLIFDNKM